MARKGKSSPAEDVIAIVAAFPWWLGLTLAFVAYVILHSMSNRRCNVLLATPDAKAADRQRHCRLWFQQLQDMSWQEFEQLVGEAFRLKGYPRKPGQFSPQLFFKFFEWNAYEICGVILVLPRDLGTYICDKAK